MLFLSTLINIFVNNKDIYGTNPAPTAAGIAAETVALPAGAA